MNSRKNARGRRIAWRWALPGTVLLLLSGASAPHVARFADSLTLKWQRLVPSVRLEWVLMREVEPALKRREPDAALRSLAAADADARMFEDRVTPYRIRALLMKDDVPRALSLYERYVGHFGTDGVQTYVRDLLAPYLARVDAHRHETRIELTDATARWNASFEHHARTGERLDWLSEAMGSGVALVDLDDDGYLDVLYAGGTGAGMQSHANRLLRNRGGATFEDVTAASGLGDAGRAYGVTAADLTGDGLPEIYITCEGRNRLFLNRGGMRFEDVTENSGVAGFGGISTAAAFADVDRDGDLDLFVARWVRVPAHEDRVLKAVFGERGRLALFTPHMYRPDRKQLFRNEGGLRFSDATDEAGVADLTGRGLGVALADFDGDHAPDLFIANDESPNAFYLNDGNGRFRDVSAATRMYDARASMGVAVFDADGDGAMDILYTNFRTEFNALAINRLSTSGEFADLTERFGLTRILGVTSWGVVAADLDNDADADVALVNGHPTPFDPALTAFSGTFHENDSCLPEPPMVFERDGPRYVDVSLTSGDFGVSLSVVGRGLAAGDVDRDGRIDLVLTSNNGSAHAFRNESVTSGHWLIVRPRYREANRLAIGAVIEVETEDLTQRAVMLSGTSYLSQNPFEAYFGLGRATVAKRVVVTWPDGTRTLATNVQADRIETIDVLTRGIDDSAPTASPEPKTPVRAAYLP